MIRFVLFSSFNLLLNFVFVNAQWSSLMDSSLWEIKGGNASFQFVDNQIIGLPVVDSINTFLCSKKNYSNFVLNLEVKINALLNSGIQIRSHTYPSGKVYGLQIEIDPTNRAYSGGIFDEQRRRWIYDPGHSHIKKTAWKKNEWNHFHIEALGNHIRSWVNNVPIASVYDSLDYNGFIGLQVHWLRKNEYPTQKKVIFRDIKIIEFNDSIHFFNDKR